MKSQPKEGKKGPGNDGAGLNGFLLIYISHPYKSMWQDVGCHLDISSVRGVLSKKVEGKAWRDGEKQ